MPMTRDPVTGRPIGVDANGNGTISGVSGAPSETYHATTPLSYGGSWGTTNPASGALPSSSSAATDGTGAPVPTNQYGTASGPGILQQWFGERANGTDPGYEYATGRGLTNINNQEAARGGFDSGAGLQQDSDYLANMGSQREGQLDTLAGGASGEYGNQLSTMLGFGTGLAGAEAGVGSAYDLGGANAMSGANNTGLGYGAQGIVLPYQANQNFLSNLMKL